MEIVGPIGDGFIYTSLCSVLELHMVSNFYHSTEMGHRVPVEVDLFYG